MHQTTFFNVLHLIISCLREHEGLGTTSLFSSKTSTFPFVFFAAYLFTVTLLATAASLPVLTKQALRATSQQTAKPQSPRRHSANAAGFLKTSPHTSSPDIGSSTPRWSHQPRHLPTRSPPQFDVHAPHNSPPRTANQNTTSWTLGVERSYHWQRAKRRSPQKMMRQQHRRALRTRQKSALPCPSVSRPWWRRVRAPWWPPIAGRRRRRPVPPVSTSWAA